MNKRKEVAAFETPIWKHKPDGANTGPRVEPSPELQGTEARCALATGSLPVSSATALEVARQLDGLADKELYLASSYRVSDCGEAIAAHERRKALMWCTIMLRRHAGLTIQRQPEENNGDLPCVRASTPVGAPPNHP